MYDALEQYLIYQRAAHNDRTQLCFVPSLCTTRWNQKIINIFASDVTKMLAFSHIACCLWQQPYFQNINNIIDTMPFPYFTGIGRSHVPSLRTTRKTKMKSACSSERSNAISIKLKLASVAKFTLVKLKKMKLYLPPNPTI